MLCEEDESKEEVKCEPNIEWKVVKNNKGDRSVLKTERILRFQPPN